MKKAMCDISSRIELLPDCLRRIRTEFQLHINETLCRGNVIGLFPNPSFGEDYCGIWIREPVSAVAFSSIEGMIPEPYSEVLKVSNGLQCYALRLYGAFSSQELSDGHDLATANYFWRGEFVGYGDSTMIGGGYYSFSENFGLFMDKNGKVSSFLKRNKYAIGNWSTLDEFITDQYESLRDIELKIFQSLFDSTEVYQSRSVSE